MAQLTALSPLALPGPVYVFVPKDEAAGPVTQYSWKTFDWDEWEAFAFADWDIFSYEAVLALSGTLHWDPSLGDDDGVGSIGDPFQTLAVINDASSIAAGTICKLKMGETFSGTALTWPFGGVEGNPITLTNYGSGADPVISEQIDYNGKDYVTINGIDADGATKGVYANGCTGIRWENGTVQNCTECGFEWSDVTGGVIDNPIIRDIDGNGTTNGDGIFLHSNCVDCTISRPQFLGTFKRQGIAFVSGSGLVIESVDYAGSALNAIDIEPSAGQTISGVTIRYCLIAPAGGDGMQISDGAGTTSGVETSFNRIHKASAETYDKGLHVSTAAEVVSHADVITGFEYNLYLNDDGNLTAYNLTLGSSQRHCVRLLNTSQLTLRNSIVHSDGNGASGALIYVKATATFDGDYNLYDSPQTVAFYDADGWLNFEDWQAAGYDANSTWEDPLFRDPDNGNYSLAAGSPALIGGEDLGDAYKWGLDPATVFPDDVRLLDRDIYYGWGRGAYIWPVIPGPYRVTYQGAYAAGGSFRHAYTPDAGDKHAFAAGANLQHADAAGDSP